ncbi:MAG: rhodanese-like domain-containing protein [Acidiferrobacterales bacterium]
MSGPDNRINQIEIEPSQDFSILFQDRGILVDVRFDEERDAFGELPNAHHLPLSFLQRFCGIDPEPYCEKFSARDLTLRERLSLTAALLGYQRQGKWLFCVCRSGNRSVRAVEILRELGYRDAYSLKGGLRVWESHLPAAEQGASSECQSPGQAEHRSGIAVIQSR